jgi:polar amino acid transport system substrate-binding protein
VRPPAWLRLPTLLALLAGMTVWAVPGFAAAAPTLVPRYAAPAASPSATHCNRLASSLRPLGPPKVTPGSFMDKIRARGYLIAGVDQNTYPFGFLNPLDGKTEGFDIDMVKAVATAIFGHPKVVFRSITDAQRIPEVRNGAVDIVAHTMTILCKRLQRVDFSTVYFDAGQRVLVLKNSPFQSLADLGGKKVCATVGSDSLLRIKADTSHPIAVAVASWTDCLALLQQGDIAAISTDDAILAGFVAQDPWTKIVGPRLSFEPYGLAISNQHPDFVRFVNAVLQRLRSDGQWAADYAHWFGHPAPSPPPVQYKA